MKASGISQKTVQWVRLLLEVVRHRVVIIYGFRKKTLKSKI